jgi:hypothetical protein
LGHYGAAHLVSFGYLDESGPQKMAGLTYVGTDILVFHVSSRQASRVDGGRNQDSSVLG